MALATHSHRASDVATLQAVDERHAARLLLALGDLLAAIGLRASVVLATVGIGAVVQDRIGDDADTLAVVNASVPLA